MLRARLFLRKLRRAVAFSHRLNLIIIIIIIGMIRLYLPGIKYRYRNSSKVIVIIHWAQQK